jgi:hypothetical protein
MIVVRVELHSAITKRVTELARMHICNIGGTADRGDYSVETFRGRDKEALDRRVVTRKGNIRDYPRLAIHVWHLVYEALKALKYNRRPKNAADSDARRDPSLFEA